MNMTNVVALVRQDCCACCIVSVNVFKCKARLLCLLCGDKYGLLDWRVVPSPKSSCIDILHYTI